MPGLLVGLLGTGAVMIPETQAAQVWNASRTSFVLAAGADPTLPANQDWLTANARITRGPFQGIYNARSEEGYTHLSSPADTEWAYGALTNHASLTYTNWEGWNGKSPPSMVGRDAVLHLISDDIYLSVKFTFWGGNSGGFSYDRSCPTPPAPPGLAGLTTAAGGAFQLAFTNAPGYVFSVLATTNITLPTSNWPVVDKVADDPPGSGSYHFSDTNATAVARQRCYRLRWP